MTFWRARRLRTLRTRVTLTVFLAVFVIVASLAAMGVLLAGRWTATDMKREMLATTRDRVSFVESLGADTRLIARALTSPRRNAYFGWIVDGTWLGDPPETFGAGVERVVASLTPKDIVFLPTWSEGAGDYALVSIPSSDTSGRIVALLDKSPWTSRNTATRATLVVSALLTAAGGLVAGLIAGRRISRPLTDAASAARAIAAGGLSTRLPSTDDPALANLTDTFNEMVSTLAERAEMDRRFNSDVSHELRSPLTTLAASIAVLQSRRSELSTANLAALDLLTADVQRFARLVDDLLEMSRMDGGIVSLTLSHVNIVEFLEEAVKSTRRDSIDLVTAPLLRIFEMEIDKRRIARVLANLIDNAFTHGSEPVVVTAMEMPPGSLSPTHVRITVEDRGEGVELERAEQLFERFNRGDRHTRSDGSGLGLALAREHVRLHGGTVRFEPPQRGVVGTRVSIFLPLAHPNHPAKERIL